MGATGLKCNFFFFKFATKSLEKKKEGACRPPQGRQAPVARWGGRQGPLMQIGTIASVAFFSYVVLYLSDYYATFDI